MVPKAGVRATNGDLLNVRPSKLCRLLNSYGTDADCQPRPSALQFVFNNDVALAAAIATAIPTLHHLVAPVTHETTSCLFGPFAKPWMAVLCRWNVGTRRCSRKFRCCVLRYAASSTSSAARRGLSDRRFLRAPRRSTRTNPSTPGSLLPYPSNWQLS